MRRFTRLIPACVLVALLLGLGTVPSTEANLASLAGKIVCLDPGHGGTDPGAVNATYDLHESDINLDVAYGLRALLEGAGVKVVMTRAPPPNNTSQTVPATPSATRKVLRSSSRCTPTAWQDPTPTERWRSTWRSPMCRWPVHTRRADPAALGPTAPEGTAFTDFGLSRFASGVLLKSSMPSTIAEPLFMSNPGEAALLTHAIYTAPGSGVRTQACESLECRRGQIAGAIYSGVLAYFGVPAQ